MYIFNHISLGELYERAREVVKEEGYDYKKGYSRASSQTSSSDDTEVGATKKKRAKLHAEERQQEKQRLTTILENIKGNIKIKEARANRAKAVQDYKLCDQLSGEIRKLLNDKADHERQVSSIERKEQKSTWYHSKKYRSKEKEGSKSKVSNALTKMFNPVEKDTHSSTTSTTSSDGTGSELSETKCTDNTSGVPEIVIPIDEIDTPLEPPAATSSLERSASNSSNDTLILRSSDEDF